MRRVLGSTFVFALTLSATVVPEPSGAAVPTIACKALSGTFAFSPPIPKQASNAQRLTITMTNAKLSGCTGAQGATGTLSFSVKTKAAESCTRLVTGYAATGTETIRWSKGKTTTVALTLAAVKNQGIDKPTANGPVTAGYLKGQRQAAPLLMVKAPSDCAKPGTPGTMTLRKNTKLTISK